MLTDREEGGVVQLVQVHAAEVDDDLLAGVTNYELSWKDTSSAFSKSLVDILPNRNFIDRLGINPKA